MNKLRYTWLCLIITALPAVAQSDDGFEELYNQAKDKANAYLYKDKYGPVTPIWRDSYTFCYQTQGLDSTEYYKVDLRSLTKTAVAKDTLDAYTAYRTPERQRGAWGGPVFSAAFPMRNDTGNRSPDGRWECIVRDHNIFVRNTETKELTQLSFDGNEQDYYVQERWSPDSKYISAIRKQEHKERQILLRNSRPNDQVQPTYRWLDYDKPGDPLPQAVPALFSIDELKQIPIDTSPWQNQYDLTLGRWSPDSRFFTFEYNQRGHQLYQLVAINTDGTHRIIAEEKSSTFVYYNDLYRHWMDDGKHILWISERDDWRHLYLIDATDCSTRQLTKGSWNVREIQHIDEEQGYILFYANGYRSSKAEDPYNKHLLRLDIKTGKITDLTPDDGNHQVTFNRDWTMFVDNWSRPDKPYESVVRSATDGKVLTKLQKQDISGMLEVGYIVPEVFHAKGRDGKTDIWGNIYRPSNMDPNRKYPVVEYIYSGPHDSFVTKDFSTYERFTYLVEMGFIVVTIDGMGTDNRSKSFQDIAYRNLKDAGFPDRILWIKAAQKKYPYMDTSKMAIYGYSAGGQNALSALLFYNDFYKVSVALCGCHDNRMDKIWWNEQWMGWPIGPWYSENSNVDNAWRMEGKLFLINGEMDDNVDPASTLQVVSELVKHGKDFEQLYLPGYTHDLGDEYLKKRTFRFFYRNCK
ncbi:MAG: DPP IV N-terminal domain-containing protein [Bacteroidaceae bacterium]|nr:DPP IV N-terminal domain-containing protein [Bacteroidaceae bacterium]